LLLAVSSVALVLGAGEIAVRLLDVGPTVGVVYREIFRLSPNSSLGFELRPAVSVGEITINAAGFRDGEFPKSKPKGVFRVAAIGDSVTFGLGLGQGATYPKRLETLLNRCAGDAAPRFEVLNFGVTGYNITQIVERLRVLALDYKPDWVVYGYVLNDPQATSHEGEILGALHEVERRRIGASGSLWLNRSRLFLMARYVFASRERSYAVDASGSIQDVVTGQAVLPAEERDPGYLAFARGDRRGRYFRELHRRPETRRRFDAGLAELADLTRDLTLPTLVMLFPLFLPGEGPYPLADVHEGVREEALAHGLTALDLAPLLERGSEALGISAKRDFLHPSRFGHRVAAVALLRWLRDAGPRVADSVAPDCFENAPDVDARIARALAR